MFLLLLAVAAAWFALVGPDSGPATTAAPMATEQSVSPPPAVDPAGSAERSLPWEARDTIAAIDAGGPFRYDRDGAVFENREGRLPTHQRGYWREYTIETPGSDDRGARRMVEGRSGDMYYTDDHYGSFRKIRSSGGVS